MNALHKNYRPLCFVQGKLLVYHKEALLLMNTDDYSLDWVCRFPIIDIRRPFCFFSLGERLAHIYAYCALEVPGGAIIAFNRGVYYLNIGNKSIHREHSFQIPDMRRPLEFFRVKDVTGFQDMVLYPDYSGNVQRHPMSINQRTPSNTWTPIYTFDAGVIQHIHSVVSDPYRDRVLILTGDNKEECAVWEAKNNFSDVRKIIGGAQLYRACCARAYPEGVLILTDAPYEQNYAYLLKEDGREVRTEIIQKLPGPTVFYTFFGKDIIFSSTVECSENHLLKHFTYKLGEGLKDDYVHLFRGNPYEGFREITRYKKDFLPMPAFEFGSIHFPNGNCEGRVFMWPQSVKKVDHKLQVYFTEGES